MQYIHKVKKSESAEDICKIYHILKSQLLNENNVGEENIKEGLLLYINIPDGIRYVVKPFDNLQKIAEKFGKSVEEITTFNKVEQIFMGQIIYIPN